MRQEMTEKELIQQIQTISLPGPDPEFEHALRAKFIEKASRKRRSSQIAKRLTWAGSLAAAAIIGLMIYQSDLLQQREDSVEKFSAENEQKNFMMGMNEEPKEEPSLVPPKASVPAESQIALSDYNMEEINNYNFADLESKGDWRFYQSEDYHQIYISKDQKKAELLLDAGDGYLNAHIYPNPNNNNQYLLVIFENRDGELEQHRYYHMDENGSLTQITDIPETGYGTASFIWSPNGETALLRIENMANHTALIGVVDKKLSFKKLYSEGEMDPNAESWGPEGPYKVSFANWLSDQSILIFMNETKTFVQVDTETGETKSFAVTKPESESVFHGQDLYSIGQEHMAILRSGGDRYDVGFEPTYRLYLVDMKERKFDLLKSDQITPDSPYEQDYLGLSIDGNPIIMDIIQKDESYTLSLRVIDPAIKGDLWKYEAKYPREIANPNPVFSPDHKKLAIRLYSAEVRKEADGAISSLPAPYYFLVFDLENQKLILEKEVDTYELPKWNDDTTLQIGEHTFDLRKLLLSPTPKSKGPKA